MKDMKSDSNSRSCNPMRPKTHILFVCLGNE